MRDYRFNVWPEKGTRVLFNTSPLSMELVSPVLTGLCGLPSGSLLEQMLPVPYFENLLGLREEGLLAQCCL